MVRPNRLQGTSHGLRCPLQVFPAPSERRTSDSPKGTLWAIGVHLPVVGVQTAMALRVRIGSRGDDWLATAATTDPTA
jgi:hypothetical protein